jgi:hypothetical protein
MLRTSKSLARAGSTLAALCLAGWVAAPTRAAAAVAIDTAARHSVTIEAARHLPVGTVVTVMGAVTVPSGVFASSFGDEGFAIQDSTGGIYVSVVDNLDIVLRQRVEVTGAIADNAGLIEIVPAADADVTVEGHAFKVRPQWERTGHVGPANQGLLINVVGIITQPIEPDPPYGSKIFISDGSGPIRVFVNTSADIDISALAPGQILSVTGFSSAFDTPEIDPRFQSDLRQPIH